MELLEKIIGQLPYESPFLFVDELIHIDENSCEGYYTFRKDEYFYQGHFKNNPVTPGVILTECMAQIGLVCLGVYLVKGEKMKAEIGVKASFVFSESKVLFEKPVYPGEKVRVVSQKKYWRLSKLKCLVEMYDQKGDRVCKGELSGVISEKNMDGSTK